MTSEKDLILLEIFCLSYYSYLKFLKGEIDWARNTIRKSINLELLGTSKFENFPRIIYNRWIKNLIMSYPNAPQYATMDDNTVYMETDDDGTATPYSSLMHDESDNEDHV